MPVPASGPSGGGTTGRLSVRQRALLRLPRLGRQAPPRLRQRLEHALLKPVDPARASSNGPVSEPLTVEALDGARFSDDQERLIGLCLAPLAGVIAILVAAHQLASDPAAYLGDGRPNPAHVSVVLAHELELVLIALAAAILVTSLLRRRLYTGIVTALYGLAVFNLHWWGFGIPFVLAGAWFMVRAYRANQAYKSAVTAAGGAVRAGASPPGPSKRYTPPAPSPRRPPPAGSRTERNAV
jgi:hypothetical protein